MVVARPDGMRSPSPVPDGEPLIAIDRVGKTYANGTIALEEISFDVHEGQFVSLVGPSGCGKSTLLRMVAGLGPITAGKILVEGLPPRRARQEKADTAFVFQDANLMPWRTVMGNVELPLELRGIGKAERRATVPFAYVFPTRSITISDSSLADDGDRTPSGRATTMQYSGEREQDRDATGPASRSIRANLGW